MIKPNNIPLEQLGATSLLSIGPTDVTQSAARSQLGLYNCTGEVELRIAIDTSAVLAVLLNEMAKRQLLDLTQGAKLYSAATLPWEVGNALSAMLKRDRITLDEASSVLDSLARIPIELVPIQLGKALALAASWNIYAYDAYMIECAKSRSLPLLSLDRRQCEVAARTGVETIEVNG